MSMRLFDPGITLLPVFCKPYPDELLTSWLTRLAHNHGMGLKDLYRHVWPGIGQRIDIDSWITEDQITQLAIVTNCTEAEVKATTLLCYRNILYRDDNNTRCGMNWLLAGTRRNKWQPESQYSTGLMFCPRCLINDGEAPYFRKEWRLATSLVCESCGCYLVDGCPNCRHGNSFLNVKMGTGSFGSLKATMIGCHTCGVNITEAKPVMAPWSVRRLQRKINELIADLSPLTAGDSRSYLSIIYHLSSLFFKKTFTDRSQQRFVQMILGSNGLDHACIERNESCMIRKAPVTSRVHVLGSLYWLLEQWPRRISEACREAGVTYSDLCSFIPNAPKWFTQPLKETLIGIKHPPVPIKERRFVNDQYYSRSFRGQTAEIGRPFNELDYDLDLEERYHTNCNIKYQAYQDLLTECCIYDVGDEPEEYDVNELVLRSRYRSEEIETDDAIVYDYL